MSNDWYIKNKAAGLRQIRVFVHPADEMAIRNMLLERQNHWHGVEDKEPQSELDAAISLCDGLANHFKRLKQQHRSSNDGT